MVAFLGVVSVSWHWSRRGLLSFGSGMINVPSSGKAVGVVDIPVGAIACKVICQVSRNIIKAEKVKIKNPNQNNTTVDEL